MMYGTLVPATQRRALRRAISVECQVVRERDFQLIADRALDLSLDGMRVAARGRVLTGEPVLLTFRVPRSPWWFDAEGTVARVEHGRRPGDDARCLGIEFEPLEPGLRFLLHTILEGVAPPVPRRGLRIDYAASVGRAAAS